MNASTTAKRRTPTLAIYNASQVELSKDEQALVRNIAKQEGAVMRQGQKQYISVRTPTADERAIALSQKPILARESERRDRLVVIDGIEGRVDPLLVSLPSKKSIVPNAISAGLHTLSLFPGIGGIAQSFGGVGLLVYGARQALNPESTSEHGYATMRTGVKHALWGLGNAIVDFASGGALYPLRAAVSGLAGAGADIAQGVASAVTKDEPSIVAIDRKPTFRERLTARWDYVTAGVGALLSPLFNRGK